MKQSLHKAIKRLTPKKSTIKPRLEALTAELGHDESTLEGVMEEPGEGPDMESKPSKSGNRPMSAHLPRGSPTHGREEIPGSVEKTSDQLVDDVAIDIPEEREKADDSEELADQLLKDTASVVDIPADQPATANSLNGARVLEQATEDF